MNPLIPARLQGINTNLMESAVSIPRRLSLACKPSAHLPRL
ncbi:hypothetical protein [Pontiella desulfatans]|nr:hypothetical protein [Pontiella desulfatans]